MLQSSRADTPLNRDYRWRCRSQAFTLARKPHLASDAPWITGVTGRGEEEGGEEQNVTAIQSRPLLSMYVRGSLQGLPHKDRFLAAMLIRNTERRGGGRFFFCYRRERANSILPHVTSRRRANHPPAQFRGTTPKIHTHFLGTRGQKEVNERRVLLRLRKVLVCFYFIFSFKHTRYVGYPVLVNVEMWF